MRIADYRPPPPIDPTPIPAGHYDAILRLKALAGVKEATIWSRELEGPFGNTFIQHDLVVYVADRSVEAEVYEATRGLVHPSQVHVHVER